jgi:hypothetical protein
MNHNAKTIKTQNQILPSPFDSERLISIAGQPEGTPVSYIQIGHRRFPVSTAGAEVGLPEGGRNES